MKIFRIAAAILTFSSLTFAANKTDELMLEVTQMQQKLDAMDRDLATKIGQLQAAMQQMQDSDAKANQQMQDTLSNGVNRQLAPLSQVGTRVDSMSDDVRALKDTINDLNARLERMDAKITDLKNQIQVLQSPPPAPGTAAPATGATGAPGATGVSGPPAGMSLEKTYTDARRDQQGGNLDLASQEYHQILTYYPDSELAANAQYYIGEIAYNKGDFSGAVQAFDAVLERFPNNPKTPDAHLMKGMALMKGGQRNRAAQEFRALIQQFPRTDDARKAQAQLRTMGLSAGTTATARRR